MPQELFQTFLRASSSTAHLEVSLQGVVVEANAAFARFANFPLADLLGIPITRVLASGQSERFEAWLSGASPNDGSVRINFSDRRGSPFSLSCLVRRHPEGMTIVGEAEVDDDRQFVSEMMRLNNELSTLARERARRERELQRIRAELERTLEELQTSYWHLRRVQEVLPICMSCDKVKSDEANWESVADYMRANKIFLSHGYCPTCAATIMADLDAEDRL